MCMRTHTHEFSSRMDWHVSPPVALGISQRNVEIMCVRWDHAPDSFAPLEGTVGQAVIGGSVAFELFAFFTIGEVLGRGQLIGYPVKPLPVPSAHH